MRPHVSERDGAELLDRDLRVDDVLRGVVVISLVTAPRQEEELKGLVYSLTPQPREDGVPLYRQPGPLAIVVLLASVVLNIIFW